MDGRKDLIFLWIIGVKKRYRSYRCNCSVENAACMSQRVANKPVQQPPRSESSCFTFWPHLTSYFILWLAGSWTLLFIKVFVESCQKIVSSPSPSTWPESEASVYIHTYTTPPPTIYIYLHLYFLLILFHGHDTCVHVCVSVQGVIPKLCEKYQLWDPRGGTVAEQVRACSHRLENANAEVAGVGDECIESIFGESYKEGKPNSADFSFGYSESKSVSG